MRSVIIIIAYLAVDINVEANPTVYTEYGKVMGLYVDNARIFFGVPYSAPPVGEHRWKPPRPPAKWSPSVFNATRDPFACPQKCHLPPHTCPNKTSEDCLTLTVFTPLTSTPASKAPVMVFFHGGSFRQGSGYSLLQDGRYIANHTDTIVVFVNYRLGALGFLVSGVGKDAANGNYGILDQRFALEWVRDNIANFGGDPNKVTIFGQSAGAQSVGIHLASSKSDSLFHYAIMESNPLSLPLRSRLGAEILGSYFAAELGCKTGDINCMRSKHVDEIVSAQQNTSTKIVNPFRLLELFEPWGPYIDGDDITEQSIDSFTKGHFQKKPIILGTTSDEARANLFGAITEPMDKFHYYKYVIVTLTIHSYKVLHKYPPLSSGDQREKLSIAGHPYLFACPTRDAARHISYHSDLSIWTYVFDHALSFDAWGPDFNFCRH
ncbi:crystal protein-like [Saccoglossus kowalevskii]